MKAHDKGTARAWVRIDENDKNVRKVAALLEGHQQEDPYQVPCLHDQGELATRK